MMNDCTSSGNIRSAIFSLLNSQHMVYMTRFPMEKKSIHDYLCYDCVILERMCEKEPSLLQEGMRVRHVQALRQHMLGLDRTNMTIFQSSGSSAIVSAATLPVLLPRSN